MSNFLFMPSNHCNVVNLVELMTKNKLDSDFYEYPRLSHCAVSLSEKGRLSKFLAQKNPYFKLTLKWFVPTYFECEWGK